MCILSKRHLSERIYLNVKVLLTVTWILFIQSYLVVEKNKNDESNKLIVSFPFCPSSLSGLPQINKTRKCCNYNRCRHSNEVHCNRNGEPTYRSAFIRSLLYNDNMSTIFCLQTALLYLCNTNFCPSVSLLRASCNFFILGVP